jgi:PHP family Zn ribbon phosphoesterase
MPRELKVDLHVHTCLSPCADNSMTPPAIAARAAAAGLAAIAICDHNTGGNVRAVQSAGGRHGVEVLAGMEVTSAEEVHLLALFADAGALSVFEGGLALYMTGTNDPRFFGDQILADDNGEPTGLEERLLIGACDLPVGELVERIHGLGGLAVASHVDKEAFSLLGQLGFIPPELGLDAIELSRHSPAEAGYRRYGLPILRSSDAHFLEDLGTTYSCLRAERATFAEVAGALRGSGRGELVECGG